jgi:hypothetical protein
MVIAQNDDNEGNPDKPFPEYQPEDNEKQVGQQ